VSGRVVGNVT